MYFFVFHRGIYKENDLRRTGTVLKFNSCIFSNRLPKVLQLTSSYFEPFFMKHFNWKYVSQVNIKGPWTPSLQIILYTNYSDQKGRERARIVFNFIFNFLNCLEELLYCIWVFLSKWLQLISDIFWPFVTLVPGFVTTVINTCNYLDSFELFQDNFWRVR